MGDLSSCWLRKNLKECCSCPATHRCGCLHAGIHNVMASGAVHNSRHLHQFTMGLTTTILASAILLAQLSSGFGAAVPGFFHPVPPAGACPGGCTVEHEECTSLHDCADVNDPACWGCQLMWGLPVPEEACHCEPGQYCQQVCDQVTLASCYECRGKSNVAKPVPTKVPQPLKGLGEAETDKKDKLKRRRTRRRRRRGRRSQKKQSRTRRRTKPKSKLSKRRSY